MFTDWLSFGRVVGEGGGEGVVVSFETGRPRSRRWKNFGCRWARGAGGLENCTIFMEVIFA